MRTCTICKDEIENTSNAQLRKIKRAAENFSGSDKEELNQLKVLALKFANKKICEYCYLEKMALLTTALRIKAIKHQEENLKGKGKKK